MISKGETHMILPSLQKEERLAITLRIITSDMYTQQGFCGSLMIQYNIC